MKKLSFFAAFIAASSCVYAQTISYGINAGLNITKAPMMINGKLMSNNNQAGFHAGGLIDIRLGSFSIQPGFFFTTKGGTTANTNTEVSTGIQQRATGKTKLVIDYMEIPLNFLYRLKAGSGDIFLGGGPYIALGLHAQDIFKGTYAGEPVTQLYDIQLGNAGYYSSVKKQDFGLNGIIGY